MSVIVIGVPEFTGALAGLIAKAEAAAGPATAAAAAVVEDETKHTLSRYSHPKGTRTTSPPGEPPAIVTGTLRRSVTISPPAASGFGRYESQVGPTVVYARVQELGGGRSRLPARPYLKPSLQRAVDDGRLYEAFRRVWLTALNL